MNAEAAKGARFGTRLERDRLRGRPCLSVRARTRGQFRPSAGHGSEETALVRMSAPAQVNLGGAARHRPHFSHPRARLAAVRAVPLLASEWPLGSDQGA
jgi:hypothetical protein